MQMLFDESEEGGLYRGLGLAKGRITRFSNGLKVPHMGWNSLSIKNDGHPLLKGIRDGSFVYFVHSYKAAVSEETLASSDYGGEFTAIVARDNVMGTQFHPEKSAAAGLRMLKNFAEMIKRVNCMGILEKADGIFRASTATTGSSLSISQWGSSALRSTTPCTRS